MSKKMASGIQRIDPFAEPYVSIAAKKPKEHYLEVYREMFEKFPDLFQQLSREHLDRFNRRVIRLATSPANLLSSAAAVSNFGQLFELGSGAVRGVLNYWHDERVKAGLREPSSEYQVGVNVANTPSEVVYESELLEVKRYLADSVVRQVPMVMFYSWINGYWILDLDEKLSLMRHLRASGIDAYITNWKIPKTEKGRNATLDDYLNEGKNALNRVSELTDEFQLGICGYCIGGVVSDILAALMPDRCAYIVNLTTGLDTMAGEEGAGAFGAFTNFEIADLGAFLDKHGGIFPKKDFEEFFDNVKPKRAVDTFFSRYVYGEDPPMDPVSFWNRKSAKEIYPVHTEFLRKIYNDNELASGRLDALGQRVDLKRITAPAQIVMAEFDHIVPMPCALRTSYLIGTPPAQQEVVLVRGGHVRAIANPGLFSVISGFMLRHSGEEIDRPAFAREAVVQAG